MLWPFYYIKPVCKKDYHMKRRPVIGHTKKTSKIFSTTHIFVELYFVNTLDAGIT